MEMEDLIDKCLENEYMLSYNGDKFLKLISVRYRDGEKVNVIFVNREGDEQNAVRDADEEIYFKVTP